MQLMTRWIVKAALVATLVIAGCSGRSLVQGREPASALPELGSQSSNPAAWDKALSGISADRVTVRASALRALIASSKGRDKRCHTAVDQLEAIKNVDSEVKDD